MYIIARMSETGLFNFAYEAGKRGIPMQCAPSTMDTLPLAHRHLIVEIDADDKYADDIEVLIASTSGRKMNVNNREGALAFMNKMMHENGPEI